MNEKKNIYFKKESSIRRFVRAIHIGLRAFVEISLENLAFETQEASSMMLRRFFCYSSFALIQTKQSA